MRSQLSTKEEAPRAGAAGQRLPRVPAIIGAFRERIRNTGLLTHLLVPAIIALALLFAVGIIVIDRVAATISDRVKHERLLLATAVAEDLDASLQHSVMELEQLAAGYRLASITGMDPNRLEEALLVLAAQSPMFTRGIHIVGPGSQVLGADVNGSRAAVTDLQRYWSSVKAQGKDQPILLTAVIPAQGQANSAVAIAVPAYSAGTGEYVVGLVDTVDSYPGRLVARASRLGGSGHADIVDRNGVALFSTEIDHILRTSDHPAAYRDLLAQGTAITAEVADTDETPSAGGPHLMAFVPLRTLPWAVSLGTTATEAFAPVRQQWQTGLAFLVATMLLALTSTVFLSRMLVQPVEYLSAAARRVANGDRDVRVRIPWGGEIGELARSLETMRGHLQAWGSELESQVRVRTGELEEKNRELRLLYETLQRQEEQVHVLLGKVLGAQEDERRRVSRELHDGIGQALSALSMGLERLEQAGADQKAPLREQVEALSDIASSALSDLRRLTVALRPAALDDLGLVPAIRRYADLYLGKARKDFEVQEDGLEVRLDPYLETVVYRVVQEAMNNIARHSGATRVRIRLQATEGALTVTVEDNGKGFDPSSATSKYGVGLQGMEERASLAGGDLTIDSRPGHGTAVRLKIPLRERLDQVRDD